MQAFGKFSTNFDVEYLTEHYIYIQEDEEKIDVKQLKAMLKNRRKTVAGTIFLYNPTMSPVGYNNNSSLAEQGFEFDGEFCELNLEKMSFVLASGIKDGYRGKLLEIKYMFNINRENIDSVPLMLEEFDADLDKYFSSQLTRYDKSMNYQDYLNIRLTGKFVFFGWGHKFDRHHKAIMAYAQNLAAQAQKLGKEVAFMHDNNYDADECKEIGYFLSPLASGKVKDIRANGFKRAFSTNPPTIQKLS